MERSHNSAISANLIGRWLENVIGVGVTVLVTISSLVLVGWWLDIACLKSVFPGLVAMNPATAVCFLLAAASLWLSRKPTKSEGTLPRCRAKIGHRRLAQAFAITVTLIGVFRLIDYLGGSTPGIDQLLFRGKLGNDASDFPNRMAPNTAFNFALLGLALFSLQAKPFWQRVGQVLVLPPIFTSVLALLGYAYQVSSLYTVSSFIPMALHTSALFVLLSAAILCARPSGGFVGLLASQHPGGVMTRRLLPLTLLIISALGWLRLQGERAGLYTSEFGVTFYTAVSIAMFGAVIWWTARLLGRLDIERQQIQQQQDRFFGLSLDLLCIAGFDGFFKNINPAWEKTLGFTQQELLSQPYLNFVHPEDRAATVAEAQKVSTGSNVISFENRYRCKDGSYRWLLWTAAPDLETQLTYAAARDITERKETDRKIAELHAALQQHASELESANSELEAFSYSVSHDLRAPLRHTSGFVELLQKHAGATLDSKGQRFLTMIAESTGEMSRLIDDLLAFSRMGRAEMRKTTLNLDQLVHVVVNDLKHETEGRDIHLKVTPLPEVQADPALMRQVMVNLISNALKYSRTRPRSEIEIGCQPTHNGEHVIFVRDNGVGFDMQYGHKLFGVFQRLHQDDDFEGTGIGLANVRRIISRHGGRAWAEGAVNQGATFYFSIPKSPPSQYEPP